MKYELVLEFTVSDLKIDKSALPKRLTSLKIN
jgi:hypothetical protein